MNRAGDGNPVPPKFRHGVDGGDGVPPKIGRAVAEGNNGLPPVIASDDTGPVPPKIRHAADGGDGLPLLISYDDAGETPPILAARSGHSLGETSPFIVL